MPGSSTDATVTINFKAKGLETIASNLENQVTAGMDSGVKKGALHALKQQGMAISNQLTGGFLGPEMFAGLAGVGGAVAGIGGKEGGGLAKGLSGMTTILGGILGFVMQLKPMQVIMQMIGSIMTLTFMPLALMLMMFMLPFLVLMLSIFKKIDMKKFMDFMMAAGTTLANLVMAIGTAIYILINGVMTGILLAAQGISYLINLFLRLIADEILGLKEIVSLVSSGIQTFVAAFMTFVQTYVKLAQMLYGLLQTVNQYIVSGFALVGRSIDVLTKGLSGILNDAVGIIKTVVSVLSGPVSVVLEGIWKGLMLYISIFTTTFGLLYGFWKDYIAPIFSDIHDWISRIAGWIENLWNWVAGTFNSIISVISSVLSSIWSAIQWVGNILSGITHLQTGGHILKNTVAFLHAGETVVPAGRIMANSSAAQNSIGNQTVNITVHAKVSNDIDMRHLAETISKAISDNRRRSVLY